MNSSKAGRMAGDDEVLTVKEVSKILPVHPETIRRLVKKGKIPSFRIGTEWRFRRDQLVRWIAEQWRSK